MVGPGQFNATVSAFFCFSLGGVTSHPMTFAFRRIRKNSACEWSAPTCYSKVNVAVGSDTCINQAELCAIAWSRYSDSLSTERCHPVDVYVSTAVVSCFDDKQVALIHFVYSADVSANMCR